MATPDPDFTLTNSDVLRLLQDPSPAARAETAQKLGAMYQRGNLSDKERAIGTEIFRAMVRDAEVRVREALSRQLRAADLPRDVALALARDVESVALPMLESSTVLNDSDLVELVGLQSAAGQTAIARRPSVSAAVADALVDRGDAAVVRTLLANEGADLVEATMSKAVDKFGQDESVQEALVKRAQIPVTIAERLVTMVSDRLRDYLIAQHDFDSGTASDLVLESREHATVSLLPPGSESADIERLIEQLHVNRRLTPSLILRALCTGDISFFEASLARLAGLTIINARKLVHDDGPLGLRAIYDRGKLPPDLFPTFRIAFDIVRNTDYDGGEHDRERFVRRLLERILTQYEDRLDPENLDYLMRKLALYSAAA